MKRTKRIVALVLTAGLLLTSLTGCGDYVDRVERLLDKVETVLSELEPVSEEASTKYSGEDTSSGGRGETTKIPSAFPLYTLTEEDIAAFEEQLLLCEELLKDAADYDTMEEAVNTLDELAYGIQNQGSIAEVLYYCNMDDETAVENYLFSTEVSTEITADYLGLLIELYDSGAYDSYFEDWSAIELKYLASHSDETGELEVRNAEILTEFYDLSGDAFEEEVGKLYSEYITNSNEIAVKSGYANYYEYAAELVYVRDYDREEREQFREYVKEYIVPIYNVAYEQYEEGYQELSREDRKIIRSLLSDTCDSLETDYINDYFVTLPEGVREGMQHMFENETFIITDYRHAYEGAFTIDIEVPYCYFGPGYQDAFTMIHEIGHYCADLNNDTSGISFDLCETHSQGNEALFLSYLGTVLDTEVYEVLADYQLYYYTDSIVQATIMDDFEETIYNQSSEVDYTTEEFDEIMHEIISDYGIDASDEYTQACMEWLWRNVGISSSVYYLSYATSAMASLSLYSLSTEDYEAALEAYRIVQEEIDYESSFKGTLERAGIMSVFEKEAYIKLQEVFEENTVGCSKKM